MPDAWRFRLMEADDAALLRGYDDAARCLFCEQTFQDAAQAGAHVAQAHGSPLAALLALDKSLTGLTDTQKALIQQWQAGASDARIAGERGTSASTLRNQRFALREREREARLFLAILSLAGLSTRQQKRRAPVGAPDARGDGVDQFFHQGRLQAMPAKESKRHAVMLRFLALFAPDRHYTDREVRELISPVWADSAVVRRYLVDTGLLCRTKDGRSYWLPGSQDEG